MNITINGEKTDITDNISISDLLTLREVKMPDMVSVELNEEILERQLFDETTVKENDAIEFLYFMGGGQARDQRTEDGRRRG